MQQGHVVIEQVESTVLKHNPTGDPFIRTVPVYVPPSSAGRGKPKLPVIYMLAGFTGTGLNFLNYSFGGLTLPERLDRLIHQKKMPPCIVVMPDCMTRYGGSQYLDSAAFGNYETHLVRELIPFIDSKYDTLRGGGHRAVLGKSSGGYGAIRLAMRHPETFGAMACHSGDMAFELCYAADFPAACKVLERYKFSVKAFFADFEAAPKKDKSWFPVLDLIAMSAAYSPNPKKKFPENFDFPIDLVTCETKPDVWKRWHSNDPLAMVENKKHQAALKKMKAVFIDCGSKDEFHLQFGARRFSKRLTSLGITHRHEEFPDSHMDISYRYDVSLPILAKAIA
jgi:S-formylglutathione hydrolase FrmB